jgi:ADP-ribose pyrophosphatase YjhB (NUDIX family)
MEKKILQVFLYNHKLKFSEIEKQLNTRSNKLAYHIKNLEKKGIIIKDKDFYRLSDTAEELIPYLTQKKSVLPVILIALGNKNRFFLYKREKRPFKNKLSLPGGRILLGETIPKATQRLMKKFKINARFQKINSITLEKVKKKDKILHTFLLIFVTAQTKDKIPLIDINKNKSKIISSDYKLIKNDINKEINIKNITTFNSTT